MVKKNSKKEATKLQGPPQFIAGVVMLVLTPVLYWFGEPIVSLLCKKNSFGGCEFSDGLMLGFIFLLFLCAWALAGLIFSIYGVFKIIQTG